MQTHDLKKEIDNRLSVINEKVTGLKQQLESDRQDKSVEQLVADLEGIRDDIVHQYNVINNLKEDNEVKLKALDTKIFASFRSFDKAFNEAGGLLKTRSIKNRKHSVNFKNPLKTK